jgi:hypothetical protein
MADLPSEPLRWCFASNKAARYSIKAPSLATSSRRVFRARLR